VVCLGRSVAGDFLDNGYLPAGCIGDSGNVEEFVDYSSVESYAWESLGKVMGNQNPLLQT